MYTLRIIEERFTLLASDASSVDTHEGGHVVGNKPKPVSCLVTNFCLGDNYAVMNDSHPDFRIMAGELYDAVYGVVICGGKEYWLFRETEEVKFSYYIMTDSGKTFERL